jgi:hypothetical protein
VIAGCDIVSNYIFQCLHELINILHRPFELAKVTKIKRIICNRPGVCHVYCRLAVVMHLHLNVMCAPLL